MRYHLPLGTADQQYNIRGIKTVVHVPVSVTHVNTPDEKYRDTETMLKAPELRDAGRLLAPVGRLHAASDSQMPQLWEDPQAFRMAEQGFKHASSAATVKSKTEQRCELALAVRSEAGKAETGNARMQAKTAPKRQPKSNAENQPKRE